MYLIIYEKKNLIVESVAFTKKGINVIYELFWLRSPLFSQNFILKIQIYIDFMILSFIKRIF